MQNAKTPHKNPTQSHKTRSKQQTQTSNKQITKPQEAQTVSNASNITQSANKTLNHQAIPAIKHPQSLTNKQQSV